MKPGYEQIRNDREINLLIEQGNRNLKVLGYTEHSRKHAVKVAETAGRILKELGYRRRQVEMAKIAGYMHDIGNTVNRYDHAHSSAVLAYGILKEREMKQEDILTITSVSVFPSSERCLYKKRKCLKGGKSVTASSALTVIMYVPSSEARKPSPSI